MDVTKAIIDSLARLSSRVSRLETLENASNIATVTEGTLTDYDVATHTATITVDGVVYVGVPVSSVIMPYAMHAGVNVAATAGVLRFRHSAPSEGRVIYLVSTELPPNPFDPITGHRHTGVLDDGPILP